MKLKSIVPLAFVLVLGGCGHALMRGSVAMKVSDEEAHVCLGDGEVEVGDRVALFRNDCSRGKSLVSGTRGFPSCHKIKIGEGTVTQVLNEHYSVIRIPPGVRFEEGAPVEKL